MNVKENDFVKFESCLYGKMARKLFPFKVLRSSKLLEIIHTYIGWPFRQMLYFILFVGDFSRYSCIYLIRYEWIFDKFKEYKSEAERQLRKYIKIVRYDQGCECTSTKSLEYSTNYE